MRKPFNIPKGRERRFASGLPPQILAASLTLCVAVAAPADDSKLADEMRLLREQNALLQQQVQKQGNALDTLTAKVKDLESASAARENAASENSLPTTSGFNLGKVNISGEGGVAFFNTGTSGFAPHSDFRVDEARLFVEAPIWNEVYFYSDVDLATRASTELGLYLGELYLDFQDVSQLWGKDNQLNVRAGRLNIPFGEEYQNRYAMENPLISHSLMDFWGIDPGVELYGALGKFNYVVAVQNGGANGVQDFDGDKSVAGRIGFDPNPHWHFSVSGLRTGDVDVQQDNISAIWFGNGWFRSIGSPATTKFHADAVQGDLTARWKNGHVSASGGYVRYGDNDPAADNARDVFYYSAEVEQSLTRKFYAAVRFSQILAGKGFPVVGSGDFNDYFKGDPTTELWRLSLGLGYRFSDRLALKAEYSFENGRQANGSSRDNEDFFGTEAVFKF
jgi:hypothetical protein